MKQARQTDIEGATLCLTARLSSASRVSFESISAMAVNFSPGTRGKYLIDTIKMLAYRAETAMAGIVREKMRRQHDARSLLRALYATEADIVPDEAGETLTIRLHHLANRSSGEIMRHLCDELNATMTLFPGTNLRLIYELVS